MKRAFSVTVALAAAAYSQPSHLQERLAPQVEVQSLRVVPTRIPTVVEVRGVMTNVGASKARIVFVKFTLMDDVKAEVGEAQALGINIEPGQSLSFVSKGFIDKAAATNVNVVDITTY